MKRMLHAFAIAVLLTGLGACAGRGAGAEPAPGQFQPAPGQIQPAPSQIRPGGDQLLLVLAEDWNATSGELRSYERAGTGWTLVGGPHSVNLGRKGLAWGAGLHGGGPVEAMTQPTSLMEKREGDGRAPAGAFALGEGFAYEPAEAGAVKLPLLRADADLLCVDDGASVHYNAFVRKPAAKVDWTSAEDMLRPDGQYRFGVLVRHNMAPVKPGGGSCIFLHIWLGQGRGTAGCTSMAPENMLALLRWIDASRQPTLVQLPVAEYLRLRAAWALPSIETGAASPAAAGRAK